MCRAAKDLQRSCFQMGGGVAVLEICPRDLKSSPWLVTVLYDLILVLKGLESKQRGDYAGT